MKSLRLCHPHRHRPCPSKTSDLAVASFVLGIIGLISSLIFGSIPQSSSARGISGIASLITIVLGLVLGCVALNTIRKSVGSLKGRELAVVGLLLGVVAFLVPGYLAARENATRSKCLGNMKQLGLAIGLYAEEHNGEAPSKLEYLKPYIHGDWEKISRCPSARDKSAPSYEMVGAGIAWEDIRDAVVLRENPANHRGQGGNVLYNDGHVSWASTEARGTDN